MPTHWRCEGRRRGRGHQRQLEAHQPGGTPCNAVVLRGHTAWITEAVFSPTGEEVAVRPRQSVWASWFLAR